MIGFAWAIPHTEAGSWWRVFVVAFCALTAVHWMRARETAWAVGATALACFAVPLMWGADQPSPGLEWAGMASPALWAMLIWACVALVWVGVGHGLGALFIVSVGALYGAHWWVPDVLILILVEMVLSGLLLATGGLPHGGKYILDASFAARRVGSAIRFASRYCGYRMARKEGQEP